MGLVGRILKYDDLDPSVSGTALLRGIVCDRPEFSISDDLDTSGVHQHRINNISSHGSGARRRQFPVRVEFIFQAGTDRSIVGVAFDSDSIGRVLREDLDDILKPATVR